MKAWQVILATVAIFVAGLVTGGATAMGVVRWWMVRHPRVNPAQMGTLTPRPGQVQPINPQLMRSFINKLDLTKEQRATIMPIVKRTMGQLQRERREVQLSTALAIEKMQDDIAEVLTPEQRAKFEDLISAQRARLQQFRQQQQQAAAEQQAQAQQSAPAVPQPTK
jgi:Spy/CpxP family protein refolding chaperone